MTKLFHHAGIKIAYTINKNLGKTLRLNTTGSNNKYERSGIYQLTCPTCDKKYIGQTGRSFEYPSGSTNMTISTCAENLNMLNTS